MTKHQIFSRYDGAKVLFECDLSDDIESRMAMRHALETAVERGANLSGANLSDANLSELVDPAVQIERLDKVREIVLDDAARLDMGIWHHNDDWKERTCAEETLCGTTHCLAGWLQVCSTDPSIRSMDAEIAGFKLAPIAAPLFFDGKKQVWNWLRDRKYVEQLQPAKGSAA